MANKKSGRMNLPLVVAQGLNFSLIDFVHNIFHCSND